MNLENINFIDIDAKLLARGSRKEIKPNFMYLLDACDIELDSYLLYVNTTFKEN